MATHSIILAFGISAFFCIHLIRKARYRNVAGRWIHHFDNLQISSMYVYKLIDTTVRRLHMPGVKIKKISHPQGSILDNHRWYLRIAYHNIFFDVCAAPFGRGYFISWRQRHQRSICRTLITIAPSLERLLYQKTYYQMDTNELFVRRIQQVMHIMVRDLDYMAILQLRHKSMDRRREDVRSPANPITAETCWDVRG